MLTTLSREELENSWKKIEKKIDRLGDLSLLDLYLVCPVHKMGDIAQ